MKKKAIVFEDDVACKEILEVLITGAGYQVFSFASWRPQILEEIFTIEPDIIFLDEWLGGLRGSEICVILKSINQFNQVPIYLLSAVNDLDKIATECKADGFIEKPFSISEIESLLFDDL